MAAKCLVVNSNRDKSTLIANLDFAFVVCIKEFLLMSPIIGEIFFYEEQ